MDRQPYVIGILGFGILSGLFSPLTYFMQLWLRNFFPAFFIETPSVMILVSSLFTSTIVIMLAGVPAALYERIAGLSDSNSVSLWIWVSTTALLSLPAVNTLLQVLL